MASFKQLEQQFVDTDKISIEEFKEIKDNVNKSAYATWLIKMILNKISRRYL